MTSFFYDVNRHWRTVKMLGSVYSCPILTVFFLGNLTPKMWLVIGQTPKRHFLAWLHVVWAILHQNPPMGHFSGWVCGKKINQNKKKIRPYISHICPDAPLRSIGTNFGLRVRLVDVINCAKFDRNRLRCLESVRGWILTIPIGMRYRR